MSETYLEMNEVIRQQDGGSFEDCLDPCCGPLGLVLIMKGGKRTLGVECHGCGQLVEGCETQSELMVKWNKEQRGL